MNEVTQSFCTEFRRTPLQPGRRLRDSGIGSWPFQAGNLSAGQSPRSPEDLVISHL